MGYATQARVLFSVLDELEQRGLLTHGEVDFIEDALYMQTHGTEALSRYGNHTAAADSEHGESEFLMAAWSVAYETLAPESGASAAQQGEAVAELYDSLLHLLERQVSLIHKRYTSEASSFLRALSRTASPQLPPASLRHLQRLLAYQTAQEAGQQQSPVSAAEQALSAQSSVLFAAFAESAASQNSFELLDLSLIHI